MKRSLAVVTITVIALVGVWVSTSKAAGGIDVCHYDNGKNEYELISVGSQNSADTHVENHQYEAGGDFIVDSDGTLTPQDLSDDACPPLE